MSKQIIFVPVGAGDPFEYQPQLKTIWPEPYHSAAAHASRVDSGNGEIFYVMYYGMVIGITGIWIDRDIPKDVFLRWTGVIPEFRKTGVGRKVINSIAAYCRNVCSERERLIELVPDNEYGHTIAKPFFEKLGFVHGPCVTYPAEEAADWPVLTYALNLKEIAPTTGAQS